MKRSFVAAIAAGVLFSASPTFAQGFNGAKLPPTSEAFGSAVFLANQAIGEAMLSDHARIRLKQTFRNQAIRLQTFNAKSYDSSNSWAGGRNCVTPVRDQGQTMMCWNFAATAALESSYCTNKGQIIDASEQSVLECFEGPTHPDGRELTGGNEGVAYDVMRGMGVEQETFNRWDSSNNRWCDRNTVLFRDYYGVEGVITLKTAGAVPTVADIKAGVIDNGAVTVMLYDTDTFDTWQIGDNPIESPAHEISDAREAGSLHEIVITGWDDDREAWRVKNSWGRFWGDGGFAWLSYHEEAMIPTQFTHVTPVTKRGAPDLNRSVLLMFERLIRIPSIWVANPRIQFPSSLGFPKQKQTLIEGTRFAIGKFIPQSAVRLWPSNVRAVLQ